MPPAPVAPPAPGARCAPGAPGACAPGALVLRGHVPLDEVRRLGHVLADTSPEGAFGERTENGQVNDQVAFEVLAALMLAHRPQLVPTLEGKQPLVVVRHHAYLTTASSQVDVSDLGPRQFARVEDLRGGPLSWPEKR